MSDIMVKYGVFLDVEYEGSSFIVAFDSEEDAKAHAKELQAGRRPSDGIYEVQPIGILAGPAEKVLVYRRVTQLDPTGRIVRDDHVSQLEYAYQMVREPVAECVVSDGPNHWPAAGSFLLQTLGLGDPLDLDHLHDERVRAAQAAAIDYEGGSKPTTLEYSGSISGALRSYV